MKKILVTIIIIVFILIINLIVLVANSYFLDYTK